MRAIAPLLLLALCACQSDSAPDPPAQTTIRIVLERSRCMGSCPVYRVEIGPDRMAHYSAPDFTEKHPLRNAEGEVVLTRALTAAEYEAIWQRTASRAFAELEPAYYSDVTDQPATIVSLIGASGTRSVIQDGAACLRDRHKPRAMPAVSPEWEHARFVPDVFCETVDLIEAASCAGYWSAETRMFTGQSPPAPAPAPTPTPTPTPQRCRMPAPAPASP